MATWVRVLIGASGVLVLLLALVAVWVRDERHAIPADERRSWREILKATPEVWRELRRELAEDRAVRRRMRVNADRARRKIYNDVFERTREQIRKEQR